MDIMSSFITLLSVSLGAFGGFVSQKKLLEQKFNLELQAKEAELAHERKKDDAEKLEKKAEDVHLLASELGREFSLTFLNINLDANVGVSGYDAKYQSMYETCSRLQMLVDLYFPTLSENVKKLSGEMNMYWGNCRDIIVKQKCSEEFPGDSKLSFKNINECSQHVSDLVYALQNELIKIYHSYPK